MEYYSAIKRNKLLCTKHGWISKPECRINEPDTEGKTVWFHFFLNKFIYLFIYFWLRWVFVAAHGLSLVAVSGGYSSLRCMGFSLQWLLLLRSTGSRGASSVVVARGLCCSVACGIFPHQGSTRVPCIGRWILNHCATREVPVWFHLFEVLYQTKWI